MFDDDYFKEKVKKIQFFLEVGTSIVLINKNRFYVQILKNMLEKVKICTQLCENCTMEYKFFTFS